jgi:hypothetical protein
MKQYIIKDTDIINEGLQDAWRSFDKERADRKDRWQY